MSDKVDDAIAAAQQPPAVRMVEIPLTLSSGRPVVLAMPVDLTGPELINLVGWLTADKGGLLDFITRAKPQLVVASSIPNRES